MSGIDHRGQSLPDKAKVLIPGGVNSGQRLVPGLEDLVITSTKGGTFTDAEGHVFTDFHAAFGPPLLGHNDPDVVAAIVDSAHQTDLAGVGVTAGEVRLAEQLVELVPSIEKVLLTSTGSEATYHALRVARAVTGRRYVVKFQGCYHGWHDAVSLNVISAADRIGQPDPISAGSLPDTTAATLVLEFNDVAGLLALFAERGDEIAAVILEPIPHNIGAVLPTHEFLAAVRSECTRHGAVLVFDEVITGFRHALGGYQSICGVTPDLTTLGKAMGNGVPIGALGGRADIMDNFSSRPGGPAFFAGTYNGHPLVVSAALATIEKLRTEPVHEHIFRLGDRVRAGLAEICRRLDVQAVVTGYGSVFVTYFMPGDEPRNYSDLLPNDTGMFVGYRRNLLQDGFFELPLNLKRSHISYAHTDDDIDRYLQAAERAIAAAATNRVTARNASTMGGISADAITR
ncbi:MAG: aspartate aminotransferase family protein [Actinobacteria bacterium 69-20]|nr:aspartate aminotransferase family protein [Actinomycetota bacterium]OJV29001.1 MAG: aspartate aminotransferase family protein [Actinobacteria bacterium 69-20]